MEDRGETGDDCRRNQLRDVQGQFLVFFSLILNAVGPSQEGDTVFSYQETKPSYPGGVAAIFRLLSERIVYPEEAKKEGVGGRVYVSFVVDTLGNVTDVHVERGLRQDIDEECVRVVRMLNGWNPELKKERKSKYNTDYLSPLLHLKVAKPGEGEK